MPVFLGWVGAKTMSFFHFPFPPHENTLQKKSFFFFFSGCFNRKFAVTVFGIFKPFEIFNEPNDKKHYVKKHPFFMITL